MFLLSFASRYYRRRRRRRCRRCCYCCCCCFCRYCRFCVRGAPAVNIRAGPLPVRYDRFEPHARATGTAFCFSAAVWCRVSCRRRIVTDDIQIRPFGVGNFSSTYIKHTYCERTSSVVHASISLFVREIADMSEESTAAVNDAMTVPDTSGSGDGYRHKYWY